MGWNPGQNTAAGGVGGGREETATGAVGDEDAKPAETSDILGGDGGGGGERAWIKITLCHITGCSCHITGAAGASCDVTQWRSWGSLEPAGRDLPVRCAATAAPRSSPPQQQVAARLSRPWRCPRTAPSYISRSRTRVR